MAEGIIVPSDHFKKKFYNFFKLNCYVHKQILNYKEIISKSKKKRIFNIERQNYY